MRLNYMIEISVSFPVMISWHFTQCRINSKGSNGLNFEWNVTQLTFKPGRAEKNESTIGPPAGIELTLLQCRCSRLIA